MARPAEALIQSEHERALDWLRRCEVSRERRRSEAQTWRAWYVQGDPIAPARVNRLRAHIDRLASYAWAPGTVRFSVHVPIADRSVWSEPAAVAAQELRLRWDESGADLLMGLAVEWALVWGSVVLKPQWHAGGLALGWIDPWDFGVGREDTPDLSEQDACVHWYAVSLPQFRAWAATQPDRDRLVEAANRHAERPTGGPERARGAWPTGGAISIAPQTSGTAALASPLSDPRDPMAEVDEPVVLLADVWERRTFEDRQRRPMSDWLVSTVLVRAERVILQRRNPELPRLTLSEDRTLEAALPFVLVRPHPRPDYLWGRSALEDLTGLQQWIDRQSRRMSYVAALTANPPKFFSGQIGDPTEAARRLRSPGGAWAAIDPGSTMQPVPIQLTREQFELLGLAERYFAEASGIPEFLASGEPQGGIRAGTHLTQLAGIGSGRIRRMALTIEQGVAAVAMRYLWLMQRHDAAVYETPRGQRFLLAQLPSPTVTVSAHSSAPVFAEQLFAKAMALQRAGVLAAEDFVDLLDPPDRERLKARAREIAEARARVLERQLEIQAARARTRPGRPPERVGRT